MNYPNYPDKHAESAYITPEEALAMIKRRATGPIPPPPESVIIVYQRTLWEEILSDDDNLNEGLLRMRTLRDTGDRIGVVGGFGIGAPAVVSRVEGLIAYGVTQFVSIGFAGSLQADLELGDIVVCDRAIRDEGTSYHYLPPSKYAEASPTMTARLIDTTKRLGIPYRVGTGWTVDAPYRETAAEVRQYQAEGVAAVDMEASALFALAEYRNVDLGAMFTISDLLADKAWRPDFISDTVVNGLMELYRISVETLTS